jgi:hypothetical protein
VTFGDGILEQQLAAPPMIANAPHGEQGKKEDNAGIAARTWTGG